MVLGGAASEGIRASGHPGVEGESRASSQALPPRRAVQVQVQPWDAKPIMPAWPGQANCPLPLQCWKMKVCAGGVSSNDDVHASHSCPLPQRVSGYQSGVGQEAMAFALPTCQLS